MTVVEQRKMIESLRDYEQKMKGKDLYDFEMFRRRSKDDEELDEQSRRRLVELFEKYVPERFRY